MSTTERLADALWGGHGGCVLRLSDPPRSARLGAGRFAERWRLSAIRDAALTATPCDAPELRRCRLLAISPWRMLAQPTARRRRRPRGAMAISGVIEWLGHPGARPARRATHPPGQPAGDGGRPHRVADKARVEVVLADRNSCAWTAAASSSSPQLAGTPDAARPDPSCVCDEGNFQLVVIQDALATSCRGSTPRTPRSTPGLRHLPDHHRPGGLDPVLVRRGSAEVVTDRGSTRVRADQEAHVEGREDAARPRSREAGASTASSAGASDLEAQVADDALRRRACATRPRRARPVRLLDRRRRSALLAPCRGWRCRLAPLFRTAAGPTLRAA